MTCNLAAFQCHLMTVAAATVLVMATAPHVGTLEAPLPLWSFRSSKGTAGEEALPKEASTASCDAGNPVTMGVLAQDCGRQG